MTSTIELSLSSREWRGIYLSRRDHRSRPIRSAIHAKTECSYLGCGVRDLVKALNGTRLVLTHSPTAQPRRAMPRRESFFIDSFNQPHRIQRCYISKACEVFSRCPSFLRHSYARQHGTTDKAQTDSTIDSMGLLDGLLGGGLSRPLIAKVTTMDADLDCIPVEPEWTGRHLFDTVCRIIGLREFWFFGLQYVNKKNIACWLQMEKKVSKQDIPRSENGQLQFFFLVKFYPEDIEEELIQDLTRHLFFLQIKQAILSQDLYCSAEAAVLLASFAVQAIYGDCCEDTEVDISRQLPKNVTSQYHMTDDMWHDRITRWWKNNAGQSREDAEMEYLRVAQDLEMYGIQYYPIRNKKETDLQLGVSAQGIGIYKGSNRITPRPFFSWSEIRNISFKNKTFNMKTVDKSTISFQAQDHSINMSILELCIGTHNLYLRRRQNETLEVQQMKVQAKEERIRKQDEQNRLQRERDERLAVEAERNQLKSQLQAATLQLQEAKENIKKTEEKANQYNSKAQAADVRIRELMKRNQEIEEEARRIQTIHSKCEHIKQKMEDRIRERDYYLRNLAQYDDVYRGRPAPIGAGGHANADLYPQGPLVYTDFGSTPPGSWNTSGRTSISHHEPMISGSSNDDEHDTAFFNGIRALRSPQQCSYPSQLVSSSPSVLMVPPLTQQGASISLLNHHALSVPMASPLALQSSAAFSRMAENRDAAPPDPSAILNVQSEIKQIKSHLEKNRTDYKEKTTSFKNRLAEFRNELEGCKNEEYATDLDRAYAANIGHDRNETIRLSSTGSARRRVEAFNGL